MRPEVAPLLGHARAAIRQSLEKRMAAPAAPPAAEPEGELSEEDKVALAQHYQSLK